MKQRAITALFIFVAYALFISLSVYVPKEYGGRYFYDALIFAMMIIAGIEMSKAISQKFGKPILPLIIVNIVLGYAIFVVAKETGFIRGENQGGITAFFGQMFLMFIVCIIYNMVSKKVEIRNILTTMFVVVYPISLMVYMLAINYIGDNLRVMAILLTFVVSSFTDMSAYFVGRAIGGPKLAPVISPKKTISGAIGGVFGGLIGAAMIFLLGRYGIFRIQLFDESVGIQIAHILTIGVAGSVINQFGDIIASYVKRVCGNKDFGTFMPGHGGVLDRVDGMMLVALFVYAYLTIYSMFLVV